MKFLFWPVVIFPLLMAGQNTLTVTVEGVKSSTGFISIAVYNHSDDFLKFDRVYKSGSFQAVRGKTSLQLGDLPDGEYALAVFHDENSNSRLDTNWLGIPKEAVGFSNARMRTFGPPSYKECALQLKGNQALLISL